MQITKQNEFGNYQTSTFEHFLTDENAIVINGGIQGEGMALEVISNLYYLSKKDPNALIKVYIINSPGGEVDAALSILDFAKTLPNPIRTIGMGLVASAAAVLLSVMATEKRLVTENTNLLYHQPLAYGIQGQVSDVVITAERLTKNKKIINRLLSNVSKLSVDQIERLLDRDCWISPEDAIGTGLIDGLLQWNHFNIEE